MTQRLHRILMASAFALHFPIATAFALPTGTLIDSPFIQSYNNWADPFPDRGANWRIGVDNHTLMETSDLVPAGGSPSGNQNTGNFVPTILVNDGFIAPANYDYEARVYTSDNDGFGLIFGYQPNGDYFRASLRLQSTGNFGFAPGLTVQKVVGGVVTQLNPAGTGVGNLLVPTLAMIDNHTPIDIKVSVTGTNYSVSVAGINGDLPLASGADPLLAAGKIGVHSWAQINNVVKDRNWGTEVETVSVKNGAITLFSDNVANFAFPVSFRIVDMKNSNGLNMSATNVGGNLGNFGLDFRSGWIYDNSNGTEYATAATPHIDFMGPAIVVNTPTATSLSDYQMKVRMAALDDDGIGVLVRVQDDNNFYRINFSNQSITDAGDPNRRAPAGLSVQKVKEGVWSELFRDNQNSPLFVPKVSTDSTGSGLLTFDLSVTVIGNQVLVQVIDDLGKTINYPVITDSTNPLLTGSVGFTQWSNTGTFWMPYGGVSGPLVVAVPEPSAIYLAAIAGLVQLARRKRGAAGKTATHSSIRHSID